MRQTIAALRALFPTRFVLLTSGLLAAGAFAPVAIAQTRDQIREQNEQLYQQYQAAPGDQSPSGQGLAPPISGSGDDQAYQAPPESSGRSAGGGGLLPQLLDRVNRLEEQNRDLSGRVDELERQLAQTSAQLNKQIGDLSFAMQQGGQARAPGAPQASGGTGDGLGAVPDHADPPSAVPPRTPEASLRAGNNALARRDYAGAGNNARAALAAGRGVHASNAEYMLAQSYAGQGNYQQAAVAYYDAYNRQPHGPLAQDALLHVGSSMVALGQNGAACEALSKLRAEFPKAKPNVTRAAATLRAKAHC